MRWTSQNLVRLQFLKVVMPLPIGQRKPNQLCQLTQQNQEEPGKETGTSAIDLEAYKGIEIAARGWWDYLTCVRLRLLDLATTGEVKAMLAENQESAHLEANECRLEKNY
ncbi:hypothetical protein llap_18089 [Limosa lapponica baueri]|uniref:Uncharacterized protein n=1 Tax=Limosa lapponica baueri TaxID=1758121 RepID=A0A2I0TCU4_LIMLA|nr:hypothetical protein llap_18089 [Limosa lapponica baueri]